LVNIIPFLSKAKDRFISPSGTVYKEAPPRHRWSRFAHPAITSSTESLLERKHQQYQPCRGLAKETEALVLGDIMTEDLHTIVPQAELPENITVVATSTPIESQVDAIKLPENAPLPGNMRLIKTQAHIQ
jgi:hypothetical protein